MDLQRRLTLPNNAPVLASIIGNKWGRLKIEYFDSKIKETTQTILGLVSDQGTRHKRTAVYILRPSAAESHPPAVGLSEKELVSSKSSFFFLFLYRRCPLFIPKPWYLMEYSVLPSQ